MNYKERYIDLKNLSHEIGHVINYSLSSKKQSFIYSDSNVFVGEVASLVNEILLNDYLWKCSSDKEEKVFYLSKIIENFISQVYRQTMYTEFENLVYNSNQLDLDLLTAFSLLKDTLEEGEIYSFQYNGIENSIYVDEITYIDISDHLSSIHMLNKQEYHFYKPLSQIVKEVDSHLLCQIHKKYYVNLKHIKLIKGNVVKLLNGEEFVIGRKYKDSMLKAYREYGKEV